MGQCCSGGKNVAEERRSLRKESQRSEDDRLKDAEARERAREAALARERANPKLMNHVLRADNGSASTGLQHNMHWTVNSSGCHGTLGKVAAPVLAHQGT